MSAIPFFAIPSVRITYPELCEVQRNVLVKVIKDHLAESLVRPRAVDQEKLLKEPELSNGKIGAACCLQAFDTADTNADMGRLNHGHIVGTIANGEQDGLVVLFDEFDDERLLERRDTAADDGLAHDGQFKHYLFNVFFERKGQRATIDDQCQRLQENKYKKITLMTREALFFFSFFFLPRVHRHDSARH